MPLRNVLVFALGASRWAVELRWVREVVALSALTPVPSAPPQIAGAMNFRGQIIPVVGGPAPFLPHAPPERLRAPRAGDQAILLEVEGTRAAIVADRVDEVTTLPEAPREPGARGDALVDGRGRIIPLVDPPQIFAEVLSRVNRAAQALGAHLAGERPASPGGGTAS
jgi:purine-binding chemotaxis protein CheW